MGRKADTVTEMNLGIRFNHSVPGSWVGEVNVEPYLRKRFPAGEQWRWSERMKEKLLLLQVHPLDVLQWPSSRDCPGAKRE